MSSCQPTAVGFIYMCMSMPIQVWHEGFDLSLHFKLISRKERMREHVRILLGVACFFSWFLTDSFSGTK